MIRVLDQHTIDKIAAGEVIERPASIVKELVENSIDAGSTRITVEITDGGTKMIRVTDNGSGIETEDVRKAYMSHATSKLDNVDDLMNILTLGFRGEALSTIAAVSKVEMITKTRSALTGIKYEIHGGVEKEFKEIGAPDGTTIISRDLFYNTPARLKFLKTNMTEGSYINDLVVHIALANPDVAIKLISNGKIIVDTQGDGRLKETIYSLYGRDIVKGLIEADYADENIKITGFIGKPYLSKGNRSFENYFVNKRYIKSPVVNRAIEEAYKTHIMQHKFPYTALFIEVPAYMVDVNVHPAKREFRFDDEKALFHAVYHAVSDALRKKEMIPDAETDYKNRQKQYETPKPAEKEAKAAGVSPVVADKESSVSKPSSTKDSFEVREKSKDFGVNKSDSFSILESLLPPSYREQLERITGKSDSEDNFEDDQKEARNDNRTSNPSYSQASTDSGIKIEGFVAEKVEAGKSGNEESQTREFDTDKSGNEESLTREFDTDKSENEESQTRESDTEKSDHGKYETDIDIKAETYEQSELSEARYLSEEAKGHHKIIGQVFNTYWITEYDNVLYLMDQHAAHEKVNYERFLAEFKERKILSQNIYPPLVINLSGREKQAALENTDYLRRYGFEVEDFGGNDVKISALPANLIGLDSRAVFTELVAYLTDGINDVTEDIFVTKLATMGCKAAIKGNQKITEEEALELIEKLMKLKDPYTCPHGRPTIVKMTKEELDKKFKRIVE